MPSGVRHWWEVNIGSGYGLVPSGTKPSSDLMLTQLDVTIYGITKPRWINNHCLMQCHYVAEWNFTAYVKDLRNCKELIIAF